jgi:tetratricopeptide (TPR) repeat protein
VLLSTAVLAIAGVLLPTTVPAQPAPAQRAASGPSPAQDLPPLAGSNSVASLAVKPQAKGRWKVEIDYFYTGAPAPALLDVYQVVVGSESGSGPQQQMVGSEFARRGQNHFSLELTNPRPTEVAVTTQVLAVLRGPQGRLLPPLASATVDQRIRWPDPVVAEVERGLAAGSAQDIVDKAVALIDTNQRPQIQRARALLQALVERNPRVDSAYVELGRVTMKLNWSPAGLRDSETLIRSALQIRPESADARILLGYVLAHQERYREAEPMFAQAAASNPPNLWLWTNWGELLAMQGRKQAAMQKYQEAVRRPPTRNTYDRARQDAYWHLLRMVEDLDGQEALYKQRAADYPETACFGVHYARFLVLQRQDGPGATAVLRDTPSPECDADEVRKVQGLVHYVRWSRSEGAGRTEALLQARAFLPGGAHLFYALAASDRSVGVARQLIAAGDSLDAQCSENLDALGHALRDGDVPAARRLLRLGAKADAPQGSDEMPAALIPVLTGDVEAIRMLRQSGVDYARLRFQGSTAIDLARSRGDQKLLQALDPKGSGL